MKALKVWWIPQIPGKPFEVLVTSFVVAKTILNVLADYDKFQYENNIKPDYANAGGLMEFVTEMDGDAPVGWCDWCDEKALGIDDLTFDQCRALDAQSA